MTTVTQMKCACNACLCIVNLSDALTKDGKAYCSEACATGHVNGDSCGQSACGCKLSK
jgi:metallothionein